MPDDAEEPKTVKMARDKHARTDEAYKSIQALVKRSNDAKSARLKESRLKQEAEQKLAPPKKDARKGKSR